MIKHPYLNLYKYRTEYFRRFQRKQCHKNTLLSMASPGFMVLSYFSLVVKSIFYFFYLQVLISIMTI